MKTIGLPAVLFLGAALLRNNPLKSPIGIIVLSEKWYKKSTSEEMLKPKSKYKNLYIIYSCSIFKYVSSLSFIYPANKFSIAERLCFT